MVQSEQDSVWGVMRLGMTDWQNTLFVSGEWRGHSGKNIYSERHCYILELVGKIQTFSRVTSYEGRLASHSQNYP